MRAGPTFDVLQGQTLTAGVGDESGKTDPHVWLDPVRFARIVERDGRGARPAGAGARARGADHASRR